MASIPSPARTRYTRSWLSRHSPQLALNGVMLVITLVFLIPLLVVISASFTSEQALTRNGYSLWPTEFSLDAYNYIFLDPTQILRSYGVTISVTVIGTVFGLLIMSLLAYVLARHDFTWRRPLAFFVFFTMLFNGGLVPTYILITQYLRLRNSLAVLILPYLVVPWFVFLLRTYFLTLPKEFIESAKLDGANDWQIYAHIVMPLSTPALATIGLFCILMFWNDWWLALLYIDEPRLYPLQYLLFAILRNAEFLSANSTASSVLTTVLPPLQTTRMAMAVVAMGPIAIAFLALQRYFIRGITLGGIKGE
ncbi:MAG: carbohydrate ABC transporter permease [Thermoflexales bacterium]|nr:carbohydrate ABC transporter permease [Thermoflexales bacterium]MDW8350545.1 carbohydrate ABC transporter permease [Anaerolineae bacterium]